MHNDAMESCYRLAEELESYGEDDSVSPESWYRIIALIRESIRNDDPCSWFGNAYYQE